MIPFQDVLEVIPSQEERRIFIQSAYQTGYISAKDIEFGSYPGGGLRLSGDSYERGVTISTLQMLTNHILVQDANGRVGYLNHPLSTQSLPAGNELIRRVIGSKHATTIEYDLDGLNSINLSGINVNGAWILPNGSPNEGAGSRITFVPDERLHLWTVIPNTNVLSRETTHMPLHIILAHELIHADRYARGIAQSADLADGGTPVQNREYVTTRIMNSSGVITEVTDFLLVEELMTVGLHPNSHSITENMIRLEHGLRERGR